MRRFFLIFGIVLMVFAFVILGLFIIAPAVFTMDDAPLLKSIMQTLTCNPNETLTASYSTYDTPTSSTRSTDLSCVDNEKHARDVSGQLIGVGAVGYLVPFLVGLFMTLLAGNLKTKGYTATSNYDTSASDDRRARVEATRKDMEKLLAQQKMGNDGSEPLPDHMPLAQRLKELKDAYSAGLVTEAEYTTKRKALIDE
jgi:hypothetical protein